jgi:hypothetical protein
MEEHAMDYIGFALPILPGKAAAARVLFALASAVAAPEQRKTVSA